MKSVSLLAGAVVVAISEGWCVWSKEASGDGLLNAVDAAFVMSLSSVAVVGNALRLQATTSSLGK